MKKERRKPPASTPSLSRVPHKWPKAATAAVTAAAEIVVASARRVTQSGRQTRQALLLLIFAPNTTNVACEWCHLVAVPPPLHIRGRQQLPDRPKRSSTFYISRANVMHPLANIHIYKVDNTPKDLERSQLSHLHSQCTCLPRISLINSTHS